MARSVIVRVRTRKEAQRWIFGMVGLLAALQLVLDAIGPFFDRIVMGILRLSGALLVGTGAILFETYKARRPP